MKRKVKGCKDCGDMYGHQKINGIKTLDNECERCNHTYMEEGCELFEAKYTVVIGLCPTCRRKCR